MFPPKPQKDFQISEKIKPLVESMFPFYVLVEPRTIPCTLDSNVHISKFRWAVTIITRGTGKCGQHAAIVVQGVNNGYVRNVADGEIFTMISHLLGTNSIKIEPIETEKLEYTERTQVWLLTSKKIKKMLNVMEIEAKAKNTEFSRFGAYSPLSGGAHNCFTWAQSHLEKVGINLGWPVFGIFFTQTKSFTQTREYWIRNPEFQKI